MGIGTTVDRLKGRVYFLKMKAEVEDYIRACSICQRKVRKGADQKHTLVSPTAGYPFQRLHVDLVGPLNESSRMHAKYILTCWDTFSKWPEAFALKEIDTLTIVRTLEEIFARFGYPEAIHSDQGPQFMAKLFKQLQLQLGIKVLTCRDALSKWPEALALKDIDASTLVQTLEKEIFARYGYPEAIHLDQGPQFMAKLFKQLQPQLCIKVTNTTGYNPKGNGQVERMHRDLNSILRALATECSDPFAWEDLLSQALFVLRTAVCKSTGLAPYQILFG